MSVITMSVSVFKQTYMGAYFWRFFSFPISPFYPIYYSCSEALKYNLVPSKTSLCALHGLHFCLSWSKKLLLDRNQMCVVCVFPFFRDQSIRPSVSQCLQTVALYILLFTAYGRDLVLFQLLYWLGVEVQQF